ncbi:hypothetical protein [Poritiphilus flavus]|uniref:Uncharacterized protein n=1 Tax=Poritiphilus flavus TaxID=2697053 RepID=A0A6L9E743_9FLAO|nr:hypothetical protein [Poritiphilus flavus]NAS10595.1 hypothetical protein [Poritiphilus flavus]
MAFMAAVAGVLSYLNIGPIKIFTPDYYDSLAKQTIWEQHGKVSDRVWNGKTLLGGNYTGDPLRHRATIVKDGDTLIYSNNNDPKARPHYFIKKKKNLYVNNVDGERMILKSSERIHQLYCDDDDPERCESKGKIILKRL